MKKKMAKTLAVLMCMMTAVAFMPTFAFAAEAEEPAEPAAEPAVEQQEELQEEPAVDQEEEALQVQETAGVTSIQVTVNGTSKGTILGVKTLTVKSDAFDEEKAGAAACDYVTFADVITTYSNAIGKKTELYYDQEYGLSLKTLFGDTSGAFGYYINDNSAWSCADQVSDGGHVTAFVYVDGTKWSDSYSYFDKISETVEPGEEKTLKLTACGYDESWNPTSDPYENAKVGYYSGSTFKELGTTDEDGKVTISIPETGTFAVTAKGSGTDILVPAVCMVTVKHQELKHTKVSAGYLCNGYEYDDCSKCGATKVNYKTLYGWSTNYVKSFKVSKGKKCFTAKWKKQSKKNRKNFSGYQLRYSKNSNMAGAAYLNVSKSSKSKKVKKLAKKTKYYVQVRSYTDSKGVRYYAGWSGVKSVKTK